MNVISNTTVLSNFAAIDRLELLPRLFQPLFLSLEVYHEIQTGLSEGYSFYATLESEIQAEASWLRLTSIASKQELSDFLDSPGYLHEGEASSLVIAHSRGWLFLTDDLAARREAKARQIPVSGTLGCLALGVENALWSLGDANSWLAAMIDAGFYSPMRDLAQLLDH